MNKIPLPAAAVCAALLLAAASARAQNPQSPYAPQNNPPSPYAPQNNPPSPYVPQNNPPPQQPGSTSAIPIPKPPPVYGAKTGQPAPVLVKYEIPNTDLNGRCITKSPNEQLLDLTGKVRFLRPPPNGYFIECFFICKANLGNDRYIIQTFVFRKDGPTSDFAAEVPNFNGDDTLPRVVIPNVDTGGISSFSKPAAVPEPTLGPGMTPAPTPPLTPTPKKSKYEGWVVRVTADGQILRVDSNQPELADLARAQQGIFDTAALHKMPPDPRSDTPPPRY